MASIKYETIFVAEPEIPAEQVEHLVAKIKQIVSDRKGSDIHEDRWGRRRLAYPIRGHREGFYSVITFAAEPTVVAELEHLYRVTHSVFRHLTVCQPTKIPKAPPRRDRSGEGRRLRSGTGSRPAAAAQPGPSGVPPSEATAPASAETSPAEERGAA